MKLYQFPDRTTQRFKSTLIDEIFDQTRCDLEESGADEGMISVVMGNLERNILSRSGGLNISSKNTDLLMMFLSEFECFSEFDHPVNLEHVFDEYLRDNLSDEQDAVFEVLVDMLGEESCDALFSYCFKLISFEDQQVMCRVLSQYSHSLKNTVT